MGEVGNNSVSAIPDGLGIVTSSTRGFRNNNPLNIRYSAANNWKGQIGKDDKNFAVFDTVINGLRAAFINLKTYNQRGINTILSIVDTWAPPVDNNPHNSNYVGLVSSGSGFASFQPLMFDFDTYSNIVKFMSKFESSYTPTDDELRRAFSSI